MNYYILPQHPCSHHLHCIVIMITLMMTIFLMSSMRGMRGSRGAYTPRGGGAVNSQQAASGLVISNVSEIQTCCHGDEDDLVDLDNLVDLDDLDQ